MTRGLRAWNRVAALVVGLALVAVGGGAVAWWHGDLTRWWPGAPERVEVSGLTPPTDGWWGWALLGAGVVLVVLGLWWLLAHLRGTRLSTFRLAGSDARGTLSLTMGPAVDHFRSLVKPLPRVTGCRATVVTERHRPVLVATVQAAPDADLPELARRITVLTEEFVRAACVPGLGVRIRLRIDPRRGRPRRTVQ